MGHGISKFMKIMKLQLDSWWIFLCPSQLAGFYISSSSALALASTILYLERESICVKIDKAQSSPKRNCQVANENFSAYRVQMTFHAEWNKNMASYKFVEFDVVVVCFSSARANVKVLSSISLRHSICFE